VRSASFCVLCVLLACAASGFAQAASPASDQASHFFAPVTTISKTVDEVDLAFTVTDKKGRFVGNLQQKDFELLDNDLAPQRLTFFQQRSDLPLHLAVLIDASSSVKDTIKFEQNAARMFLKKILRPGTDLAFVVEFKDQVRMVQQPTDKMSQMSRALKKVNANGDTALYDAVIYASETLRQIPEHQITRRGIIVITDGVDTVKRSTLEQARQAVAHAEAMVFAVSTNITALKLNPEGDLALTELSTSSGGVLLHSHEDGDLLSAFRNVEKALRNQYVIAYNPADFQADGSYRRVELVPHKKNLRTNCRKGYYAVVRHATRLPSIELLTDAVRNALH